MLPVLAVPPAPVAAIAQALADHEATAPVPDRAIRRRLKRSKDEQAVALEQSWSLLLGSQADDGWCERTLARLEDLSDPTWLPWRETTRMVSGRRCHTASWPPPEQARVNLDGGDWTGADRAARSLGAHPDWSKYADRVRADLLEARAAQHFSVGEHEQAIEHLREALALVPSPDRRLRLGLSLMPIGLEEEARAQLTVGLLLGDNHPTLADRARMALSVLGDPADGHPEALIERAERD